MSSTSRNSESRDPHDYYPTQPWMVHRLLERIELPGGNWTDPCAGDGAIVKAIDLVRDPTFVQQWSVIEIQPRFEEELCGLGKDVRVKIANYLDWSVETLRAATAAPGRPFDVGITNPPFVIASEVTERLLASCRHVAILQRINWLAGPRADWFRGNMPDLYVLPERGKFDARGGDSIEYGWFHWPPERDRTEGKLVVLGSTPADVRKAERAAAIATMERYGIDPMRGQEKRSSKRKKVIE